MLNMKRSRSVILLMMLTAALVGCKGESPTAPPSGNGGGSNGSGGVTPPVGANVALTASSTAVQVNSLVTLTATVTVNGQPVANGTAVEFKTDNGTFTDVNDVHTIRTTTNGVATVVLTNAAAGVSTVTATVNNVTKSIQINFSEVPVTPPPPSTAPTITSVTPNTGPPSGGTVITITGTNFRTPVRVLVNAGPAGTKEAFVNQATVTPTQITAVMPAINLVSTQTQAADITVIVDAGNPTEARVTKTAAFTYVTTNLTPVIRAISPTSGPIDGGTRVTIIGDAFEQPVQVFFGNAQAQVISVDFNQIIVIAPTARDTSANGSGTVTGAVDVKVLNVNSGKSVTSPTPFRYTPKMVITTINPTTGTALGGTDITIDGTGFNEPLTVDIGGVRATVLSVHGTQILARTGRAPSPCAGGGGGSVTVTNTDNGDTAVSVAPQTFTYIPVSPVITSITSGITPPNFPQPGNTLTIGVLNPGIGLAGTGNASFTIGGTGSVTTPQLITIGTGTQSFGVVIPNLPASAFPTIQCTSGGVNGTQLGNATFPVIFTNTTTSCISAPFLITVAPPSPNPCVLPPPPTATVTAPTSGCADAGSVPAAAGTGSTSITIANTGGQPLTLSAPSIGGTNAAEFTIAPTTARTVAAGTSATYNITFDPAAAGARSANVTFTTNDPINPTVTVCLTGTGTP